MGIFFLLIPVLFVIFLVNDWREKRGLSSISSDYAIPIVLVFIAWFTLREFNANLTHFIAFGFGLIVAATFEYATRNK